MEIKVLNPIEYPGWDELLLTNDQSTFFHTTAWAKVLSESYQYKPLYFTIIEDNKLTSLVPIMEVKSFLTGKRGVSLPFTDHCPPLFSEKAEFLKIIEEVIRFGKEAGWKYSEWRSGKNCFGGVRPFSSYYEHTLDLSRKEKTIFSNFRDSTGRNIKKATSEGVEFKMCNSLESMKAFYRLNCITRKHHGLPPQPFFFFKKLLDHVIFKDHGLMVLATFAKKVIAGAVFLHFDDKAIYKFGASDRIYHHLRPNNLVMWEAIKWYASNGFKNFSFGRTEPENQGLLQFKRGWGTQKQIINYYRYDLAKSEFVKEHPRSMKSHNFIKKLPSPLLNLTGSILYRHVG